MIASYCANSVVVVEIFFFDKCVRVEGVTVVPTCANYAGVRNSTTATPVQINSLR